MYTTTARATADFEGFLPEAEEEDMHNQQQPHQAGKPYPDNPSLTFTECQRRS